MTNKKVFGSFFIALIISTFLSIGQSTVYATCTGIYHADITNPTSLTTDQKVKYKVIIEKNDAGCFPLDVALKNSSGNLVSPSVRIEQGQFRVSAGGNAYEYDGELPFLTDLNTSRLDFHMSLKGTGGPENISQSYSIELAGGPTGNIQITPSSNNGGGNTGGGDSGGGASVLGDENTEVLKSILSALWFFIFPFAVVVAVIKLLINIIQIASSSGNPQALAQAKDEAIATFLGLLLIAGAVTFIRIMGGILGI